MDKSLEILLVAAVILVTSTVVLVMFQGQAGVLPNFSNSTTSEPKCDYWEEQGKTTIAEENGCDWVPTTGTEACTEKSETECEKTTNECEWEGSFCHNEAIDP